MLRQIQALTSGSSEKKYRITKHNCPATELQSRCCGCPGAVTIGKGRGLSRPSGDRQSS